MLSPLDRRRSSGQRRLSPSERLEAAKLARAISTTTRRYREGFMAFATFRSHVRSLWGTVEGKGLTRSVKLRLGKLRWEAFVKGEEWVWGRKR